MPQNRGPQRYKHWIYGCKNQPNTSAPTGYNYVKYWIDGQKCVNYTSFASLFTWISCCKLCNAETELANKQLVTLKDTLACIHCLNWINFVFACLNTLSMIIATVQVSSLGLPKAFLAIFIINMLYILLIAVVTFSQIMSFKGVRHQLPLIGKQNNTSMVQLKPQNGMAMGSVNTQQPVVSNIAHQMNMQSYSGPPQPQYGQPQRRL